METKIVIIVGCGGMGLAIARRLGVGRRLHLADYSRDLLDTAQGTLTDEGYSVETTQLDVADFESVNAFAHAAAMAGQVEAVVHTAGLSPSAGSAQRIFEVDLLGTAHVIDAFQTIARPGMSLVCISSMAGHMVPDLPSDLERHLATAPRGQLLGYEGLRTEDSSLQSPARAYGISKRGNILRVQASVGAWGRRGARVNSVSPGVISTSTGRNEIAGAAGKFIASSPAGRVGTPQDIVNAVAFLCSPESSYITGNDLLVDGGVVSNLRWDGIDRTEG